MITTALSVATESPLLRQLALTSTFEDGFSEAASGLIRQSGMTYVIPHRGNRPYSPFPTPASEVPRLVSTLTPTDSESEKHSPINTLTLDIFCVRVKGGIGAVDTGPYPRVV